MTGMGWVVMACGGMAMACGGCLPSAAEPLPEPATYDRVSLSTAEDTPIAHRLDGAWLPSRLPARGSIKIVAGELRYTPAPELSGFDSFSIKRARSDDFISFDVMVTPVNDAPRGVGDSFAVGEDSTLTVSSSTLLANDSDIDLERDALTVAMVGDASNGTVAHIGSGVSFTPAPGFVGQAGFRYHVSDGELSTPVDVVVLVDNVNDAPVAFDDEAATDEDTAVEIPISTLTGNDLDIEGQTLGISNILNAVQGSVSLANGVARFTPTLNFTGTASFDYHVTDGAAGDIGRVTVTVRPVNDAPTANDNSVSGNEDVALDIAAASLLGNDSDIDGQSVAVTAVGDPVHGAVSLDGSTIRFVPEPNFVGSARFSYSISDGALLDTAVVFVDVKQVNDAPNAADDSATTGEDTPLTLASATLRANDTDIDSANLTVTAVDTPVNGTVVLTGGNPKFIPAANFIGEASFRYTISDGSLVDTAIVTIAVFAVDDAPTAVDDNATTDVDASVEVAAATLLANDFDLDGPAPALTAVQNPIGGTVALSGASIQFAPSFGFAGTASFDYVITGGGLTDVGRVFVAVVPRAGCGNGAIDDTELCDDGDATSGDGCSAGCQLEPGFTCSETPSVCTAVCGDGLQRGDEQCDDGNLVDVDGCTSSCRAGVVCAEAALPGGDRFAVDPATGHCYVSFDDVKTTFASAQAACGARGGYLTTITSADEDALVRTVLNPAQNPWIGASEDDNDADAVFDWVTTEPFAFSHFAPGEPDNGGAAGDGDCLHITNAAGEWEDTSCTLATFVTGRICEIELDTCGDTVVQSGETCDDGGQVGGDGCSATCQLEVVTQFSFPGAIAGDPTFPADGPVNPGLITTPVMFKGPGLTNNGGFSNAFSARAWTQGVFADPGDYFAFVVIPTARMSLVRLELDEFRNLDGIHGWSLRSSLDGFTADLKTFVVPDNDQIRAAQRIDLPPQFRNLGTAVEFRIFAFQAETSFGGWAIDNVKLFGDTHP